MGCDFGLIGWGDFVRHLSALDLSPCNSKFILSQLRPSNDHTSNTRWQISFPQNQRLDFDASGELAVKDVEVGRGMLVGSHSNHDPPKSANVRH